MPKLLHTKHLTTAEYNVIVVHHIGPEKESASAETRGVDRPESKPFILVQHRASDTSGSQMCAVWVVGLWCTPRFE